MQDRVRVVGATTKLVIASDALCVGEPLSATLTVKDVAPAVFGVPVIAPVEAFKFNPPDNAPTLIEYAYGVVPPLAVQVPEYPTPTCAPAGKLQANVNVGGATVKLLIACVAACTGVPLSVALTVNDVVPDVFGVPVIAPVDVFKLNPPGNTPTLIE